MHKNFWDWWIFIWMVLLFTLSMGMALLMIPRGAHAHDHDKPFLNNWMKGLRSGEAGQGALCCSGSDATVLAENEWTVKDGHYRVMIEKEWVDVPDSAVVQQPNLDGRTLVWPVQYFDGEMHIRCFLPGAGT